jgi:molybdenum cofactor biosynthesis enzyme MoaA
MKLLDKYSREFDELIFNFKINYFSCFDFDYGYSGKSQKSRNLNKLSKKDIKRLSEIFIKLFEIKKIGFEGKNIFSNLFIEMLENYGSLLIDNKVDTIVFSNAMPFKDKIFDLNNCGVKNLNIRLDTLNKNKFNSLTGSNKFNDVLDSILLAERSGFFTISIECVVMKGVNDDELNDFIKFIKDKNINIKFMEYVSEWNDEFDSEMYMSIIEMKKIVGNEFQLIPFTGSQDEIAYNSYVIGERGTVSFICQKHKAVNSNSNPVRISSDGILKVPTFDTKKSKMNLIELLRSTHLSNNDIAYFISLALSKSEFKYSELEEFYIKNVIKI